MDGDYYRYWELRDAAMSGDATQPRPFSWPAKA